MNLIIAIVLISGTITIMFSQEFTTGFRKIFAIPGMRLLLPLFVMSYLLLAYKGLINLGLEELELFMADFIGFLKRMLPFEKGGDVFIKVGLLSFIALIPQSMMTYKKIRNIPSTFQYAWLLSLVSWIFLLYLLL